MKTFEKIKRENSKQYLREEYIYCIRPISEQAIQYFADVLGKTHIYGRVKNYKEKELTDVEIRSNAQAIKTISHLKNNKDYVIDINNVVHHEYDEGLTWDDIQKV
ncbi:hypothetical protein I6G41_01985 [Staphylococcus equorum]|uniref:hypothetical protein n=1 Tax=Staphylococcus equorum TaxID=246432 RepID=UPI0018D8FDD5|nr:hypothetical protein [Staphylococcus equorum]QPS99855.1 hypothetical protein I6G41_01985 [Staphylococcus equorum]